MEPGARRVTIEEWRDLDVVRHGQQNYADIVLEDTIARSDCKRNGEGMGLIAEMMLDVCCPFMQGGSRSEGIGTDTMTAIVIKFKRLENSQ